MRHVIHFLIAIVILGVGFLSFNSLKGCKSNAFSNKKSSSNQKGAARSKKPSMIKTKVQALRKIDYQVKITTHGEVRAHHNTSLTSQVGGRVLHISPQFEDGAFFNKGDVLLELEVADYLTEIEDAKAQLARAESAFMQEKARAKQALLNWKDAGFEEDPSDLVLRKPQLREAEANVSSTASNLERAQRNLTRTKIKAPYNGRVRIRNVGIGQQVGANTTLGEIYTTDVAQVRLPITSHDLKFYSPPNKHQKNQPKNSTVSFESTSISNEKPPTWTGEIILTEGELDAESRQIFVISRIQDPFGLTSKSPPLYLGQSIRATIPVRKLQGVYNIPRRVLSALNQIIVVRDGCIKRIDIEPLWSTQDSIIIKGHGILPHDLLATTRISYAPEGAPVQIIVEEEKTSETQISTSGLAPVNIH